MMMSNLQETYYLVNDDGEVIDKADGNEVFTKLQIGDRVLRKNSIEKIEKAIPLDMRFMKMNYYPFREISSKYSIFIRIIEYLQYETGKIVFRNGNMINRKTLLKLCGVSKNTFDKQMNGLIKDDAIKSVRDGKNVIYFVNPYIVHIGKKMSLSLYDLFKNTQYKRTYERTLKGDKK